MAESVHRDPDVYHESPYLAPHEVEALLQRLSAKQERTSVHDVAEATGLTPEQVQLVVSEMRRAESEVARQRKELDELRDERDRLKRELEAKPRRSSQTGSSVASVAFLLIICLTIIALKVISSGASAGLSLPAPPPVIPITTERVIAKDQGVVAPTGVQVGTPAPGSPTAASNQ